MWIMLAPSSTARRASAAYSSGVYGIAGHWSRFATAPEIAQVIRTGSSTAIGSFESGTFHSLLCPKGATGARNWPGGNRVSRARQWYGSQPKGNAPHARNDHRGDRDR